MSIYREDYYAEHCPFPLAFVQEFSDVWLYCDTVGIVWMYPIQQLAGFFTLVRPATQSR